MSSRLPRIECPASLEQLTDGKRSKVVVAEAYGSATSLWLASVAEQISCALLIVAARNADAHDLQLDFQALGLKKAFTHLPERETHEKGSPEDRRNESERERALQDIRELSTPLILTSIAALADRTGDPSKTRKPRGAVKVGERIERDALRRRLYAAGLEPAPLVSHPGEVSFRGDIVDFFPFGDETPVRIELFDDEVESIRRFDPESQRSTDKLKKAVLPGGLETREIVQSGQGFTAFDHFREPPIVVEVDPAQIQFVCDEELRKSVSRAPLLDSALKQLEASRKICLHPEFQEAADEIVGARPIDGCAGLEELPRFASVLGSNIRALHLFSNTAAEGRRLTKLLRAHLPASPRRAVHDERGNLTRGFILPSAGIWVGNHHELLSRRRLRRVEKDPALPTRQIKEALELSPGDYVVHLTHGVGLYRGMKQHQSDAGTEDYLILEFSGGTLLFVPSSKIELLSRYIGAGGSSPKLDKIGGKSWSKKKANVEEALGLVAEQLLDLQASRKTSPGFAFEEDDEMQAEFEASFPYADTSDQVNAGEEIKRDMQSPRSMDRLLCGDVGFGKTELAIRAAFKAAKESKQVAILAPTTLLVRQHLEVFRDRMADYPLRIESLSRFTSGKKVRDIVEGVAEGKVDIIIGTHRLLSGSVIFKDLGLLVIDEEQRFGVRHKEALKLMKTEVDVLTLSATPIPRTMHMALVGLRDVSTLRVPPRGRQAIDTRVTYYDDKLIENAIVRELDRDGQVFYLFNRVQKIEERAAKIRDLVPQAKVSVAHGQMPGSQLERAAMSFQEGKVDVLVCTSIIESGIDIPKVNTLIVERADRLGLSDLHQLRGRIGRSDRKAYAFFMMPHKPLPAIALKRLRALEGLSHLGSGFDVAIRDLEIRGAGNLLGSQQSGHIEAVGYELYCRLLAKVVAGRRGKRPPPEPEEIDISLSVPAFLPREYIHSTHQRMGLMRRLGEARGSAALGEMEQELRDRFGRLPAPAQHLLQIFHLKDFCRRYGMARIFYPGAGEVLIHIRDFKKFSRAPLAESEARYVEGQRVILVLPARVVSGEQVLSHLLERFVIEPAIRQGKQQPKKKAARGKRK